MTDEATKVFAPDPPPANMDAETAEWIMRQLRRVSGSTQIIETVQKEQDSDSEQIKNDLNAHTQNKTDPHETLVPWDVDGTVFNLYPNTTSPNDAGIGTLEKSVAHIAIGTQEAPGTGGMEGFLMDMADADGGGVLLMGLRGVDPANPPSPVVENSPVWVLGNPVVLGNQVMVELDQPITADHEVLFGPTVTLNGRHFSPLLPGPEKVYSQTETATDATDVNVLDLGEVEIVSLTLVNSYVVGATLFFQVYLENLGNQATDFDVILKVDGVEAARYPRTFIASGGVVAESFPIQNPINAAQVLSLDVEATSTGPQSQGWVRGALQTTTIRIQQG